MVDVPFEQYDQVRVGIVGCGRRGGGIMLRTWLVMPEVRVTALCDMNERAAQAAAQRVRNAGQPDPALYTGGERDFENLCARDDIDFVFNATPWEWHHPVCMSAMRNGKHVGTEMPLAMDLRDLWQLVNTSELTRRHCIMMENVSYGRHELRLLRMAHDGLFGDLTHGAGGYIHDLRATLFEFTRGFSDDGLAGNTPTIYDDASTWRRLWYTRRDGSFYHVHGLAPIAACMDINRGDRFTSMMAVSSPPLGLAKYREANIPRDHRWWNETYIKGDRTTCLIETAKGRFIRIEHDECSPHPYSRVTSIAGTNGIFEDYVGGPGTTSTGEDSGGQRIYLESDMTNHTWGSFDDYAGYEHWLWQDIGEVAEEHGGHGGMDYVILWRLVQAMRLGLVPDMDVYDGAAWSAPVPLSTESLKRGSGTVKIPDFTRGNWQQNRPGLDSDRPAE